MDDTSAVAGFAARQAITVAEVCDWYLASAMRGDILGRQGERIKASRPNETPVRRPA
jgi:hypothetical protein